MKTRIAAYHLTITESLINENSIQNTNNNDIQKIFANSTIFIHKHQKNIPTKVTLAFLINLGIYHYTMGGYKKSSGVYEEALKMYQGKNIKDVEIFYKIHEGLAVAYEAMGQYVDAQKNYELALKVIDSEYEDTNLSKVRFYNNIATFYRNVGEIDDAEKSTDEILRMIQLRREQSLEDDIDYAVFYCEAGNLYSQIEQWDLSQEYLEEALSIGLKLDENSLQVARAYNGLGCLYISQGRYDEAEVALEKSLTLREKILYPSHPDVLLTINNLSAVYQRKGKDDLSRSSFEHIEKKLPTNTNTQEVLSSNPEDLMMRLNIASSLSISDDPKDKTTAEEHLNSVNLYFKTLYPDPNNIAWTQFYSQAGNIYNNLGKYDKGQECYEKALNIYECEKNSTDKKISHQILNILESYKNLALDACSAGKFDIAINLCKKAIIFSDKYPNHTQHEGDLIRIMLANDLFAKAKSLQQQNIEAEQCEHLLKEALGIALNLLDKYITIIKKSEIKSPYDLSAAYPIVKMISTLYGYQGKLREAADIFRTGATALSADYSIWKVLYLRKAISRYRKVGLLNARNDLSQQYAELAEIYWSEKLHDKARKTIQKAIEFESDSGKRNELTERLDGWIKQLNTEYESLDSDIYIQMQRAYELWFEIKFSLIRQANKFIGLRGRYTDIENMIAGLSIRIRSLLDQGYARIIRQSIYEENGFFDENREGEAYWRELYYPYATKWDLVENQWKVRNITTDQALPEGNVSLLKINPAKNLIKTCMGALTDAGFINNDGVPDEEAINKDGALSALPEDYQPYCNNIKTFLKEVLSEGKSVTSKGIALCLKGISAPPAAEQIAQKLEDLNYIKVSGNIIIVQQEFSKNTGDPAFCLDSKEPAFAPFEKIITARLLSLKPKKDFNTHCAKSAQLLKDEQPCTYYSLTANQQAPLWQGSWFETVLDIANEAKHVRVTPQSISDEIAKRHGLILLRRTVVNVSYVETKPNLAKWSFVQTLKLANKRLTSGELISLSQEMETLFRNKGYFQRLNGMDILCQPILETIYAMAFNGQDQKTIVIEMKKFHQALMNDLLPEHKQYSRHLAVFFIRRKLQEAHLQLDPNYHVEIESLFNQALSRTEALLKTFSSERPSSKIARHSWPEIFYSSEKLATLSQGDAIENLKNNLNSAKENLMATTESKIDLGLLRIWHQCIIILANTYLNSNNLLEAGNVFLNASKSIKNTFPWLVIRYLKKAIAIFKKTAPECGELLEECYLLSGETYFPRNYGLALKSYEKAYKINYKPDFFDKHEQVSLQMKQYIDSFHRERDIFHQMEYINERFLQLQYLMFKLSMNEENASLKYNIANIITEIAIKLHHILDQAWGRYLKMLFYSKGLRLGDIHYDFHFPCAWTEKDCSNIFEKGDNSEIKIEDFQIEVVAKLIDSQPRYFFSEPDLHKTAWLDNLMRISNASKHDFMFIPSKTTLSDWLTNPNHLYPLDIPVIKLNEASFVGLLGGFDGSSKLFELLKQHKYISTSDNHLGEIQDKKIQELVRLQRQGNTVEFAKAFDEEISRLKKKNIDILNDDDNIIREIILLMTKCYNNHLGFNHLPTADDSPFLIEANDFLLCAIQGTSEIVEVLLKNMSTSYKPYVPISYGFWASLPVNKPEEHCNMPKNAF